MLYFYLRMMRFFMDEIPITKRNYVFLDNEPKNGTLLSQQGTKNKKNYRLFTREAECHGADRVLEFFKMLGYGLFSVFKASYDVRAGNSFEKCFKGKTIEQIAVKEASPTTEKLDSLRHIIYLSAESPSTSSKPPDIVAPDSVLEKEPIRPFLEQVQVSPINITSEKLKDEIHNYIKQGSLSSVLKNYLKALADSKSEEKLGEFLRSINLIVNEILLTKEENFNGKWNKTHEISELIRTSFSKVGYEEGFPSTIYPRVRTIIDENLIALAERHENENQFDESMEVLERISYSNSNKKLEALLRIANTLIEKREKIDYRSEYLEKEKRNLNKAFFILRNHSFPKFEYAQALINLTNRHIEKNEFEIAWKTIILKHLDFSKFSSENQKVYTKKVDTILSKLIEEGIIKENQKTEFLEKLSPMGSKDQSP